MDVVMLNNQRLKQLRSFVGGKDCIMGTDLKSQYGFCLKTGRCSVGFLEELLELLQPHQQETLREWMIDSLVTVPEPTFERSPELEDRIRRFKKEAENQQYREMTRDVDPGEKHKEKLLTFGTPHGMASELKSVNKQAMLILNMVLTVLGAFAAVFKGLEYSFGGQIDFVARLLLGSMVGFVVFVADMYFVLKSLNKEQTE